MSIGIKIAKRETKYDENGGYRYAGVPK